MLAEGAWLRQVWTPLMAGVAAASDRKPPGRTAHPATGESDLAGVTCNRERLVARSMTQQHIQEDLKHVRGDQPSAFPEAVRQPQMQTWTQGHFLLQCYKELAQHHGHMELTRDVLLGHGPGN